MAMYDMRLETMQPALAIEDVELAGSLSGYASVFGLPDLRNDVVGRGALARSLAKAACRACGCSGSMMRRSQSASGRQSARMRAAFMSRAGWRERDALEGGRDRGGTLACRGGKQASPRAGPTSAWSGGACCGRPMEKGRCSSFWMRRKSVSIAGNSRAPYAGNLEQSGPRRS